MISSRLQARLKSVGELADVLSLRERPVSGATLPPDDTKEELEAEGSQSYEQSQQTTDTRAHQHQHEMSKDVQLEQEEKLSKELRHQDQEQQQQSEQQRRTQLVNQVWPALVVMGDLDPGLRVGGVCTNTATGRRGTVLGVSREGALTSKVLWEDTDASVR